MRPDRIVVGEVRGAESIGTGENTKQLSLPSTRYAANLLAPGHSAYGFHLKNVIAKRLGMTAAD